MKNNQLNYLQSREKIRIKKLMALKQHLTLKDYLKMQSVFLDDCLYFSSFELFMEQKTQLLTGSQFIDEWLVYLLIDKTVKKWLSNNHSLDKIAILVPHCGSGSVTQLVIEYLLIKFKQIYSEKNNQLLLEQIIRNNIVSWDTNPQALEICKNRIKTIFNVYPVLKNTTTLVEKATFDIILGHLPSRNLLSDDFKNDIHSLHDNVVLDFIDWSLHSLNNFGEVCFIVPTLISYDSLYHYWRKSIYKNLALHTVISIQPYNLKSNYQELVIIGMNNQKNYTIESITLENFSTQPHIAAHLFYDINHDYKMFLK